MVYIFLFFRKSIQMADFLDSEAEESDDEELSPSEKKKLKRHKAIDSDDEEEEGMSLFTSIYHSL